jgi:hypothetical protein
MKSLGMNSDLLTENEEKMSFTRNKRQLVWYIDKRVREILSQGGNEISLLIFFTEIADELKTLIIEPEARGENGDMDRYTQKCGGFYYFMNLLERLADPLEEFHPPKPMRGYTPPQHVQLKRAFLRKSRLATRPLHPLTRIVFHNTL